MNLSADAMSRRPSRARALNVLAAPSKNVQLIAAMAVISTAIAIVTGFVQRPFIA